MYSKVCCYICVLVLSVFQPAFAQSPPSFPQSPNTEPLTSAAVAKVYEAYKDLLLEYAEYEPADGGQGIIEYFRAQQNLSKVDRIVAKHGFNNMMEWYMKFMPVMRVYAAHKMQASQQKMPQLEQQMAEIQKNPQMTQEQKDYAINMMKASQGMMQSMFNASATDLKAVEPYVAKFDKLLDKKN